MTASTFTGLIAGWMLATTFYFIFWARVATADVLTVCGVLAELAGVVAAIAVCYWFFG